MNPPSFSTAWYVLNRSKGVLLIVGRCTKPIPTIICKHLIKYKEDHVHTECLMVHIAYSKTKIYAKSN